MAGIADVVADVVQVRRGLQQAAVGRRQLMQRLGAANNRCAMAATCAAWSSDTP